MPTPECKQKCIRVYFSVSIAVVLLLVWAITYLTIFIIQAQNDLKDLNDIPISQQTCSKLCSSPFLESIGEKCCIQLSSGWQCVDKQSCRDSQISTVETNLNNYFSYLIPCSIFTGFYLMHLGLVAYRIRKIRQQRRELNRYFNPQQTLFLERLLLLAQQVDRQQADTRVRLAEQLLSEQANSSQSNDNCMICLQSFHQRRMGRLNCGHSFHSECIRKWIERRNTCPHCRAVL